MVSTADLRDGKNHCFETKLTNEKRIPVKLNINSLSVIDRTIKIFDVIGDSYTPSATIQGHEGPVWEVSWAHPKFGVVLASCSFDGTVMIHREIRPRVWTLLYTYKFHESSVNTVKFAPHEFGLILAAGSSDGKVSILSHQEDDTWSAYILEDNPLGVNALSWGPYKCLGSVITTNAEEEEEVRRTTAATEEDEAGCCMRLVTGGSDNKIRFWRYTPRLASWTQDSLEDNDTPLRHNDWVRDVAWAPCCIPINIVASCSEDKTVIIWLQTEALGSWQPTVLPTFDDPVWRVSWSLTGNILAVSSGDNTVTLWKAALDGTWSQISSVDAVPAGDSQITSTDSSTLQEQYK